jgi:hypothetical protein
MSEYPAISNPDVSDETCLRLCDEALINWLKGVRVRGQIAKVTTAWNSRSFAQQHQTNDGKPVKQSMPLPRISLSSTTVRPDSSRWTKASITSIGGQYDYTNTSTKEGVYSYPWPMPITMGYQVDIWTKTQQDMRTIRTSILSKFQLHPDLTYVVIDYPVYGPKEIFVELTVDTDNSNLEAGESDRELRHTISLDVQGYIFKTPDVIRTIRNAHVAIIDGDPKDDDLVEWYSDNTHYTFNSDYTAITAVDENSYSPPSRILSLLSWDISDI